MRAMGWSGAAPDRGALGPRRASRDRDRRGGAPVSFGVGAAVHVPRRRSRARPRGRPRLRAHMSSDERA